MDCLTCRERMNLLIDNMLTEDEKAEMMEHIRNCNDCRTELQALSSLVNEIKALPDIDLPASFHDQMIAKLRLERKRKQWVTWGKRAGLTAAVFLVALSLKYFADTGLFYNKMIHEIKMQNSVAEKNDGFRAKIVEKGIKEESTMESPAPAQDMQAMEDAAANKAEVEDSEMHTLGAASPIVVRAKDIVQLRASFERYLGEHPIEVLEKNGDEYSLSMGTDMKTQFFEFLHSIDRTIDGIQNESDIIRVMLLEEK